MPLVLTSLTTSQKEHIMTHEITRKQDGIWLSAKCSCGKGSHLTTKAGQVTRWINKHLASAS